jgi:hypothetical protein
VSRAKALLSLDKADEAKKEFREAFAKTDETLKNGAQVSSAVAIVAGLKATHDDSACMIAANRVVAVLRKSAAKDAPMALAAVLADRAVCQTRNKDLDAAWADIQEATKIDSTNVDFLYRAALIVAKRRDFPACNAVIAKLRAADKEKKFADEATKIEATCR